MFKIDVKDAYGKTVKTEMIAFAEGDQSDPSENEKWYDAEIAPILADLAKKCHAKEMAFAAAVEYGLNEVGTTVFAAENVGTEMQMIMYCVKSKGNFDRYVNWLRKYVKENNIENQSIYLNLMELKDKEY